MKSNGSKTTEIGKIGDLAKFGWQISIGVKLSTNNMILYWLEVIEFRSNHSYSVQ